MSSKQAFFTGLAVGASGTGLGALLVTNRQRLTNLLQRTKAPRQALAVNSQSGPANGTPRVKKQPKPIPALAAGSGGKSQPKPIPGLTKSGSSRSTAKPIPVLATSPTTLQAAAVEMKTGSDEPYLAQNSYRVVRADGSDTGLAVTPYLDPGQANGKPAVKADAWGVTHTGSGALVDGPYDNIEQAQELATKLSNLSWSGAMSMQEVSQAQRIVQAHRKSRAGDCEL
ncbi:MAG: hypothetical protein KDE34_19930 [Anaerolineales bacterium]|nr:hypothetical protein [Anaerolineales bacterium]